MINFDWLLEFHGGDTEWINTTVDNWQQFYGFVGPKTTVKNIKVL